MNEKALSLSGNQQIGNEFRAIFLTALIATAIIWFYLSMNLLWTALMYFGFLLFISLVYGSIDNYRRDVLVDDNVR